jgi:hypothetical protein
MTREHSLRTLLKTEVSSADDVISVVGSTDTVRCFVPGKGHAASSSNSKILEAGLENVLSVTFVLSVRIESRGDVFEELLMVLGPA